MKQCPTLRAVLELERDEWYGNKMKAQPGPTWQAVSQRLFAMLGQRDLVNILLEEED
jgi:hypothetical protein